MANEEHLKIIKKGVDTWNQWRLENKSIQPDLRGADLRGLNLAGINLDDALLDNAKLMRTDLQNSTMKRVRIRNANLRWAILYRVNLQESQLIDSNFQEMNLSEAKFDKANIQNSVLKTAQLQNASFNDAIVKSVDFSQGSLIGATINKARLTDVNFTSVDLTGCVLCGSILERVILANANLTKTDLTNTSLIDVDLSHANLFDASAPGVDFTRTKIDGTEFIRAIADEDNFKEGQLSDRQKDQLGFLSNIKKSVNQDIRNIRTQERLDEPKNESDISQKEMEDTVKNLIETEKNIKGKFIDILVQDKGIPPEGISEKRVLVNAIRRVDIDALFIKEGDKILAVIEYFFESVLRELVSETTVLKMYREQAKLEGCPMYIACLVPKKSKRLVDIYEVTDSDIAEYITIDEFPNYEKLKQIAASRKLTLSAFKDKLNEQEKRMFDGIIELADSSDVGLCHDISDESYINLKLNSLAEKSDNVVVQLHRYGKDEKAIAFAVAGVRKGTEQKEPKFNEFTIFKGDIGELSGFKRGSAGEKAWLNGNLPVKGARAKASVYVHDNNIINNSQDPLREIKKLFLWAIEQFNKIPIKARPIGNVATMADDRTSSKDLLGRENLVQALANMFVHTKEMEGFTVALFGNWGVGKSTVMDLLEKQLKTHHPKHFVFAKFNAWAYEKTDNIAAGLAYEVVKALKNSFKICRLTLYICFIVREHWGRFIRWIIKLGLAALPFVLLYLFRSKFGLTEEQEKTIKDLFGIGLAGGAVVIGFYVLKNFKNIVEHPLVTNLETCLNLPNYDRHLGLVPVLKRHIKILCGLTLKAGIGKWRWGKDKKLVVFVDDLDRCQPKCIAETLDAIRLVMDNPNVIVLIGIDHRIAFKAIEGHYKNVSDGKGEIREEEIARDYLGKIIQLPIRLQEPTVQELEEFINKRLFPNAVKLPLQEKQESQELTLIQSKSSYFEKEMSKDSGEPPASINVLTEEHWTPEMAKVSNEKFIETEMQDSKDECDEFSDLAKKFEFSNPRQLLRLRNSYRLIKALELQKAHKNNQELGYEKLRDLMRMLFWQEFLYNRPKDLRQACLKTLYEEIDTEKISDKRTKDIIKQVKDLILESFKDKKIHDETAEDVRIVVLPHSQED